MIEDEHHHHPHGTGIRWLDVVMTVAVVAISVISLIVSVNHGRTMERLVDENRKMVSANTMPYLEMMWQGYDPDQQRPVAAITLQNSGIGPAVVDWVQLTYKGKAYPNAASLLGACCNVPAGHRLSGFYYSTPSGRIVPAHESLKVLWFEPKGDEDGAYFNAITGDVGDFGYSACYCSVLDECWISEFDGTRPRHVDTCPKTGVTPFR